ncbi:MAG: UDP-GlcNAc--UDP-phosphate GlcNAc-1-phosphate transferase [Bacteroidia bacterium]
MGDGRNMWVNVLISAIILAGAIAVYFRIVRALKMTDTPNPRSSHQLPTIRGGGIIFPIALLLFIFFDSGQWLLWTTGVFLAALVSFWDDWREVPAKWRLVVYFIAAALLIAEFDLWQQSVPYSLLLLILFTGIINAYNFMDGINGITGAYSLLWLLSIFVLHWHLDTGFPDLFFYIMSVSLVIFILLNFRKRALCFAGDVGSISIALILLFPTFWLIHTTGSWIFLLLLAVYGIDSVLTIFYRLIKGENIFRAHRHHIYQNLANEWNWEHLPIALLYTGIQLLINILMLQFLAASATAQIIFGATLLLLLSVSYYLLKRSTLSRFGSKNY